MGTAAGPDRVVFDVWSRFYDLEAVQQAIYRPVHRAVARELAAPPAHRILDVGCGTGILTSSLAKGGVSVCGCDWSLGMLQQAKSRRCRACVQGDAQRLPFRSQSVDAVVLTESFHWFPDQDAALTETARVLVPGGRLLAAMVNVRTDAFSKLVTGASRLIGEPWHWPTKRELVGRMDRAGLQVVRQERIARLFGIAFPSVLTVAVRVS
jgi:ubiquinone/menaquinone biosynthesis C-methylase UbiE